MLETGINMGGDRVRENSVIAEDVARHVIAFQDNYEIYHKGLPEMSPESVRFLSRIGNDENEIILREKIIDGGTPMINDRTEADLRLREDSRGSLIHTSWRLTRQVRNFIESTKASKKVEPLHKSFVLIDGDPCVEWSKIESTFRFGASLLLSRLVSKDLEIQIQNPTLQRPSVVQKFGNIQVVNTGTFNLEGNEMIISDYIFKKTK